MSSKLQPIETPVACLLRELGLGSTVSLRKELTVTGELKAGASLFLPAGMYLSNGVYSWDVSLTQAVASQVTFGVYYTVDGVREQAFTTLFPANRMTQMTLNNASSLPHLVPAPDNAVWELRVESIADPQPTADGLGVSLIITPN